MQHAARSLLQTQLSRLLAAVMALLACFGCGAHAGEHCATEPNLKAAPGSHWYYRVDRASQRKCWFLGRADIKVRQTAPAKAQSAAEPKPLPEAFRAREIPGIGSRWLDPPIATAENAGTSQSTALASASMREPEPEARPEAGAQPETASTDELPPQGPVLAASESPSARSAINLSVEPAHLIALLAAALGLAAVMGRLIFQHSVLFSA